MQFLDKTGVGTLWSMCKTKFALAGHTHNSLAAVGNEQISATAYSSGLHFKPYYSSGGPTTYGNILEYTSTNTGGGQLAMEWTGSQTKSDGTDSNVGRVYYRSKRDCINGWTKWMTLAYTNDIPTKLSQLTNDKGFVTGSVSGNTVTINGVSTTWTNTWRGIQDNLTSTSTSDSLSANQGRILKGLVDGKANSSHTHNYLPLSGGTLTGDLLFSNSGTTFRQIKGTCGDNDFWRIGGGATGNNAGYMEVATADDGTEPIYVRQYSGTFSTITRTATLLDGSGNTSFPGTVAAVKFKGALEGNASTASNAATVNGHTVNANVPANAKFTDTNTWRGIQDNLTSTSTSESLSANQGRILKGLVDGKANSSHTHTWSQISGVPAASTTQSGIMSSTDKAKLDGIASGANNYKLPTATETTLGGIKVDFIPKDGNCRFKVQRDVNGNANTFIPGLKYGDDECLNSVQVRGDSYTSIAYTGNGVTFNDQYGQEIGNIRFRGNDGYFALTSDIPDVSNLCRFNFVNSISECRSDRINFILMLQDNTIQLEHFDSYPDGTILIITTMIPANIIHQSGIWYSNGERMNEQYSCHTYIDEINLITKNNGTVYHYRF